MAGDVFRDLVATIINGHSREFQALVEMCAPYFQYDGWWQIGGEGLLLRVKNSNVDFRKSILKIPKPEICEQPHMLDRFFSGCGIQSMLHFNLPVNVPEIYQVCRPRFYEMEFVSGINLLEYAQKIRNDSELLATFLLVLRVASDVHEYGYIHRDLKPQNILIKSDRQPVLIDFGLAKKPEIRGLTAIGRAMGSKIYASPQACRDSAACSYKDDVWSLARMMWVVFTRKEPAIPDGRFATHDDFPEWELPHDRVLPAYLQWRERPFETVKQLITALGGEPKSAAMQSFTPVCEVKIKCDKIDYNYVADLVTEKMLQQMNCERDNNEIEELFAVSVSQALQKIWRKKDENGKNDNDNSGDTVPDRGVCIGEPGVCRDGQHEPGMDGPGL